jgi:transposase-like protein
MPVVADSLDGEGISVDMLGREGTQDFTGTGTWHRATQQLVMQKWYAPSLPGKNDLPPGKYHFVDYWGGVQDGVWNGLWSSPSLGTDGKFVYHLDEASLQAHTEAGQREVPRKRLHIFEKRTWKHNVFASNTAGRRESLEEHETLGEEPEREKLNTCMVPHCGAAFEKPSALKDHERTHTLEKPFGCTQCPQSFSQLSNLRRHERTHDKSKPFQCSYCSKMFNDTSNRRKHESRKHNVRNAVLILDGNMYVDSAPCLLFQVE